MTTALSNPLDLSDLAAWSEPVEMIAGPEGVPTQATPQTQHTFPGKLIPHPVPHPQT